MKKNKKYGVVVIEKKGCMMSFAELTSNGNIIRELGNFTWNPEQYIEEDGVRLFEELSRKIKKDYPNYSKLNGVIISMPGTIRKHSIVCSSSRIGIRRVINAGEYLNNELGVSVKIVHDMDCMLVGAFKDIIYTDNSIEKSLCYIVADEGIGSTFMINGMIHHGAGIAGHISRLVVEKKGTFYRELSATGTLEAYVSRSGISKRCAEKYLESLNKIKRTGRNPDGDFRRCLGSICKTDPGGLKYDTLNLGVRENDEIATSIIKEASEYMGQAINAIITIVHPHEIVLSGNLITNIDGFYDRSISEAEKLSWPAAWNTTNFRKSNDSRQDQLSGAFMLAASEDINEVLGCP